MTLIPQHLTRKTTHETRNPKPRTPYPKPERKCISFEVLSINLYELLETCYLKRCKDLNLKARAKNWP